VNEPVRRMSLPRPGPGNLLTNRVGTVECKKNGLRDRRQYLTIRKNGAESLRVLLRQPGCRNITRYSVPAFLLSNTQVKSSSQQEVRLYRVPSHIGSRRRRKQALLLVGGKRYYSTIREDGAESLQGLSETAGLPKCHLIFGPGFFVSVHENFVFLC
jgi:hypothetical protein